MGLREEPKKNLGMGRRLAGVAASKGRRRWELPCAAEEERERESSRAPPPPPQGRRRLGEKDSVACSSARLTAGPADLGAI